MATAYKAHSRLSAERIFYTGMAAAMLVAIFIGFAPSYYLVPVMGPAPYIRPATPLVHAHGMIFSAWVLLFMAQVSLVAAGRRDIHRLLGSIGVVLAVAMVVFGTLAALHGVARASGPPIVPPLSWLAVPLLAVPVFGGLIAAALWKRNAAQTHKRLMLLAMIVMLAPAFARMPWFQGMLGMVVVPDLFLLALVAWDLKTRSRIHPVTLWGGLLVILGQTLPFVIWQTDGWLGFARWATSLVA